MNVRKIIEFEVQNMDWLDYREKLGIGLNDSRKVTHFIIKIFNKRY